MTTVQEFTERELATLRRFADTPPAPESWSNHQARTRNQFCQAIAGVSEERWCSGWHVGIVDELRREGGLWTLMAAAAGGWPKGLDGEDGWDPLTEVERTAAAGMFGAAR